jgi:aryl-alcohol dehydrogenase-like predicted oxidoreductase
MNSVEASLKRLGLDYIDLYQVHGADLVTPIEETMRALDNLVSRGLVRYIGASNMAAWQIMKALGLSRQYNCARFETVQSYYTIAGRELEREIIPMLTDQQLGLMVWSPLAGGLLSGKFARQTATPNHARRLVLDFPPVNKEHALNIVDAIRPIAEAHGVSVARIALAWLLHQKAVMSVIIGAKSIAQLDDNLAATDIVLSADELAALDKASALNREYPQWMLDRQHGDRVPATVR